MAFPNWVKEYSTATRFEVVTLLAINPEDSRLPRVAIYGGILLLAGVAYFILTKSLIVYHGKDSLLAASVGRDR